MKPTLVDENSLIHAARGGDLEAFNQIVLAHQNFLYRTALNILGDEDAADDATQEALISAFRNFRSFRGASLRAWLTRVVINSCYDELRRRRRHPTLPIEQHDELDQEMDAAPWLADPSRLPQEQVEARELERAIRRGLDSLPPQYRFAAVLVDVQGLSYDEAAEALGIPVGTVKSRVARARLGLRTALARHAGLLPHDLASSGSRVRMHEYV
ncbi:MAG: RNA polymerase sigma factor [Bacteroidota bacterium]